MELKSADRWNGILDGKHAAKWCVISPVPSTLARLFLPEGEITGPDSKVSVPPFRLPGTGWGQDGQRGCSHPQIRSHSARQFQCRSQSHETILTLPLETGGAGVVRRLS